MRLKKQLLLASLFTLSLPWVGCQYIQEMETALHKGQHAALSATAKAVVATIENDDALIAALTQRNAPHQTQAIYLHPLQAAVTLDGYREEWQSQQLQAQQIINRGQHRSEQHDSDHKSSTQAAMHITGGQLGQRAWLFINIATERIHYFNPSQGISGSDHLSLHTINNTGQRQHFKLSASNPGKVIVTRHASDLNSDERGTIEHQIKAIWRESQEGFQIEAQLPLSLIEGGLGIDVISANSNFHVIHSNINQELGANFNSPPDSAPSSRTGTQAAVNFSAIPPVISLSEKLNDMLGIFERDGIALKIATYDGALVAQSGSTSNTGKKEPYNNIANNTANNTASGTAKAQQSADIPYLLTLIYGIALDSNQADYLPPVQRSGYFDQSLLSQARNGLESSFRYQQQGQTRSAVSIPIHLQPHSNISSQALSTPATVGVLIAEQSAASLTAFTNTAFSRLLLYSILVSLCSALTLVAYASWLSFRIRRLSRSAANAISDSGTISDDFKASKLNDEIGDMSRSFGQLHSRLKEYTHYLKTLSSKLSHELRTPLAIVSSSLDNLEHEQISEQAAIYALRAKEGSSRLSGILNAMGAASRVEQAISSAEIETIPVDELLNNLTLAYADIYPKVNFGINIQANHKGYKILGSGELLVQMLDKLVDNAADFCPSGGKIELGLYAKQQEFVITVRNEGPTLPKMMHQQLFDSMVSMRDSSKESGNHLGLGLHIVRLIVEFHQGSVQCYNVPDNSGVIFEIHLPSQTSSH